MSKMVSTNPQSSSNPSDLINASGDLFEWQNWSSVNALADKAGFLSHIAALRSQIGDLGALEREMALHGFSLQFGGPAGPDDGGVVAGPGQSDASDRVFATPEGVSFGLKSTDSAIPGAASPVKSAALTPTSQSEATPSNTFGGSETASGDAGSDGGAEEIAITMNGGLWGRILVNVERSVDRVDNLTNSVAEYLDRPDISGPVQQFMERFLDMLDNLLVRLDGFLDVVDRWAPPGYDDWITSIRERIAEERDDIDAILNPPAPVEPPVEEPPADDPPQDDDTGDGSDEGADETPEEEWTAADFTGEGKTVVVVDTGWNTEFLGSDEAPVDQFDFFSNDSNAQVANSNDHGSWVDQVIRTVADGVEMIHLKVFPDTGGGAPFSVIEAALDWVIDAVEADSYDISAVNLSLGYGNVTSEFSTGLSDEFAALDDLGVFSVVAAGNSGESGVQYLAADANTIAVSASTSSADIAGFSQADEELTDIFALGQSVRIEKENGGADSVSGTSFSAPYVSGIAARLQEAADELIDRSLTDDEFVDILQISGQDLNGYTSDDDPAGYHIADADAAVTYFIDNYTDFA